MPVWNWEQRDAGLQLADQAQQSIAHQVQSIKLKVAGLVRTALMGSKTGSVALSNGKKSLPLD